MIKVRIILVFKIIAHVNWLCSKNPKGLLYCDNMYSVCVCHIIIRCKAVQLLIDAMLMK